MWRVIAALSRPWILYRGSSSLFPDHTKAHHGLLVEEEEEEEEEEEAAAQHPPQSDKIKRVEIKSHLSLGRFHNEMNQIVDCEIERLSKSPFAKEAISASGNDGASEREIKGLGEYIERVYRGLYVEIEEYVDGKGGGCVD